MAIKVTNTHLILLFCHIVSTNFIVDNPMTTFTELEQSGEYFKYFLRNCHIHTAIGIYAHEKGREQEVILNVEVLVSKDDIPTEENPLASGFNYDVLFEAVQGALRGDHIFLQETLIQRIKQHLFEFPEIIALRIRSEKVEVYPRVEGAGIECTYIKNNVL